jgi:AmmeMemoRadiSam system protein A
MAAAFWDNPGKGRGSKSKDRKAGVDLGLSSEEKALLLQIAREEIEAGCRGGNPPDPEISSPNLNEARGAFVTIHKDGKLRGCIGDIHGRQPLAKTVAEMAVAAAFHDPRFPPVTTDELNHLDLEISVLTPLRQVSEVEEIVVGTHGIYMKRGKKRGLLLPQVATEWGWDRTTFLEHTCTKAGLPRNSWKDKKTEIYIFSADIFEPENL